MDYSSTDLFWTNRGDWALDNRGDLMDTSYNPLRSIVQEIRSIMEADTGDWAVYPQIGADLDSFLGEPNNRALAQEITARIKLAITSGNLIRSNDLLVDIIPVSNRMVRIQLRVNVAGTSGLEENIEWLVVGYLMDTIERGIMFEMGVE